MAIDLSQLSNITTKITPIVQDYGVIIVLVFFVGYIFVTQMVKFEKVRDY